MQSNYDSKPCYACKKLIEKNMLVCPYCGTNYVDIASNEDWIYYTNRRYVSLDDNKVGKWMYYFDINGYSFAESICLAAVNMDVVCESKHTSSQVLSAIGTGVCCFYLNGDDFDGHRKLIRYFLDNGLIRRSKKTGKLYNISFKFDNQTRAHLYGKDYKSEIKLDRFIDLYTGDWLI